MNFQTTISDRTVLKYYLYMATKWAHLAGPIWVLFLLSRGISYTQIGLLDSFFAFAVLFGEVPTGFLGDRIGRRNSLLIGIVLLSLSSFMFAFTYSFYGFVVLYIFWSLGQSFQSGTDSAWLFDILKEQEGLDQEDYTRIRGRGNALGLLVSGAAAIAGGYLGEINLAIPWIISGTIVGLGFFIVLTFPDSAQFSEDSDEKPFTIMDVLPVIRERFINSPLGPFVVYVGLFFGVLGAVEYFIQPISVDMGISVTQIGWIYGGFTVVSASVSYFSEEIKRTIGIRRWFNIIPPVLGVLFIAILVFPAVAIPLFFLMKGARNGSSPLETQYINDNTVSKGRATAISIVFMVHSLFEIPLAVGAGALADFTSPLTAIILLGILLATGSITIQLWQDPVSEPDNDIVMEESQSTSND
ncbi:MFS transporter [Natrinema altunense]|uniref:MFS transporter n=1 Tax=Natrinema altunense TaxID=222984 RepID=A0A482XUQ5_9EURY|nr:MFS transporter [Natrinema altunense]RZH66472.1 MFS transporter [Natrinema altunense]